MTHCSSFVLLEPKGLGEGKRRGCPGRGRGAAEWGVASPHLLYLLCGGPVLHNWPLGVLATGLVRRVHGPKDEKSWKSKGHSGP